MKNMKSNIAVMFLVAVSVVTAGEKLEINGAFKAKKRLPTGWVHNRWKAPHGEVELIKGKQENIIKITAPDSKTAQFFAKPMFVGKTGDTISITIQIKGTGKAGTGLYIFDGTTKKWLTRINKTTKLTKEFSTFKNVIKLKKYKNATALKFRVFILAEKNSTVYCKNIEVEFVRENSAE